MAPPLLDTSVVMRYLIGEPAELARRAVELVEGEETVLLSELALAEAAYVLTSFYDVERQQVAEVLIGLVERANVRLCRVSKPLAVHALKLAAPSRRVSFTDALLWAEARTMGVSRILTFDRRFPADGVELAGLP